MIAAQGAIKKGPEGKSFRIVHDGTHKMLCNYRICPRDLHRFTTYKDAAALLGGTATSGAARFALLWDVEAAHRLVKIREEDWGYQASRIDDGR